MEQAPSGTRGERGRDYIDKQDKWGQERGAWEESSWTEVPETAARTLKPCRSAGGPPAVVREVSWPYDWGKGAARCRTPPLRLEQIKKKRSRTMGGPGFVRAVSTGHYRGMTGTHCSRGRDGARPGTTMGFLEPLQVRCSVQGRAPSQGKRFEFARPGVGEPEGEEGGEDWGGFLEVELGEGVGGRTIGMLWERTEVLCQLKEASRMIWRWMTHGCW